MLWTKATVVATAACMALVAAPVSAQGDDEDDRPSGGTLAVLLLTVGGGTPTSSSLQPQLKTALDKKKTSYSAAQLRSLSKRVAAQVKAKGNVPGTFKVCADGGRPCVKVVRE